MAYRRTLSIQATLFARRLNPSISYISHHGSDDHTKQGEFRSFKSYVNNNTSFINGTFSRSGYGLVGNGLLLNRYMSTSIGEADKISSPGEAATVITDDASMALASHAPTMSEFTSLYSELGILSLPFDALWYLIHGVHVFTGLNWWASIALTTLLFRGLTIPFLVHELKCTSKFELMRPRLEEIKQQMWAKGMKPEAVAEGHKKMEELCEEYGLYPKDPTAELKGLIIEGTLMLGFTGAILFMAKNVSSLTTGGTLWFTDLTSLGATSILPFFMVLTYWWMFKYIWHERQVWKAMITMSVMPLAMCSPQAMCLYLFTSDVFSLCVGYILRAPIIKQALGIPETPVAPPSSALEKLNRMHANLQRKHIIL